MISRADFIDLMSGVYDFVDSRTRSKVAEIIQLCEKYRHLAERFTFDRDGDLDSQVNDILIGLSDLILGEMEAKIERFTREEDKDAVLLYVGRETGGESPVAAMDRYCSHLKYLLEGWIAIGFAGRMTGGKVLSEMFAHLRDSYETSLWKEAFRKGGYESQIIAEGGYRYGKGILASPVEGMTLVGQNMLNEAYQYGTMLGYRRRGALGYRVHRGSTYDCPVCDALCIGIHPVTEICLPAHPRCCCWTTPVFGEV